MVEDDVIELKRVPGTCCPEPSCDKWSCHGCEYRGVCRDDPQKFDYCPLPRTCQSCGADCTKCPSFFYFWDWWLSPPISRMDFSKMTEGQALYSLGVRATEQDGKKGLLLPSPDKTRKPLFIQASDEQPEVIVASEHKESRVKGAKKTRCHDCKCKVWISPNTQHLLKRYPGTPVICIACFVKRAEEESKNKKEV